MDTFAKAGTMNPPALIIGIGTLAMMLLLNRFAKRVPVALIAITLSAVAAWWLRDAYGVRIVRDIAAIPPGVPALSMPAFDREIILTLLPSAMAIAAIAHEEPES